MELKSLLIRVACVAAVVCLIFPAGQVLFPLVARDIGDFSFSAVEAVFSTSLGFGIYAMLFG